MHATTIALALTAASPLASFAQTTQINPSRYRVEGGVAFAIANSGFSSFLFTWSDGSGTFSSVEDPTLELVAGQTYTFQRTSGSHPFALCDDSLPVAGADGSYSRTTTDVAVIGAAILSPAADFTADPAPTSDLIIWTPSEADIDVCYYSCLIGGHTGMVGRIEVIAAACVPDTNGDGDVTPADFNAWVLAFNQQLPACDQNGDGACTPADFNAWILNFNAGC